MTDLRTGAARVDQVPMPLPIAALPRNKAGYPIPWFIDRRADVDGEPDFRIMDERKLRLAVAEQLCWVCGTPLARLASFVIGPMCAVNRTSAEPPCHHPCATYSARVCPFLSTPAMTRRERHMPEGHVEPPGVMLRRNPGVTLVWTTAQAAAYPYEDGLLFEIGEPKRVEWWTQGRPATAAEVLASIDSGMPALREMTDAEGEDAEAELTPRYGVVVGMLE